MWINPEKEFKAPFAGWGILFFTTYWGLGAKFYTVEVVDKTLNKQGVKWVYPQGVKKKNRYRE